MHDRGRFSSLVLSCAAAALLAAPASAAVHPRTRLDQAQTVFSGGLSVRAGASQTITVGRSGHLVRVDLAFCTYIKGSMVLLTAANAKGRRPDHTSTALTFRVSTADCHWQTFTFKHPLAVKRGEVVRLTVSSRRGEAPLWASDSHKGDPYRRGSGAWMRHRVDDFAFRTYVRA